MIATHRGAFEYDWRNRFNQPLTVIGESMTWGEAVRLCRVLSSDPSSQVFAAGAGWDFPVSREWIVMADHRDSTEFGRVGKKAKVYPRPWPDTSVTKLGAPMTAQEFRERVATTQAATLAAEAATELPSDPEGSA